MNNIHFFSNFVRTHSGVCFNRCIGPLVAFILKIEARKATLLACLFNSNSTVFCVCMPYFVSMHFSRTFYQTVFYTVESMHEIAKEPKITKTNQKISKK